MTSTSQSARFSVAVWCTCPQPQSAPVEHHTAFGIRWFPSRHVENDSSNLVSPRPDHQSQTPRQWHTKSEFFDSFGIAAAKQGPSSPTCVQFSLECLGTRTKESKHVCMFLTIFTRLEPTAMWFACEGTGVSTGGRAHSSPFFCITDQGVRHLCTSFFCLFENAWICARPTTDRGLASVIPDRREKEKHANL